MSAALLVRLQPATPWRLGEPVPGESARTALLHSDTLYSAVCSAMGQLGWLEEWLAATAAAEIPAVRLSSVFPAYRDSLYVAPPRHLWPPRQTTGTPKVRWKSASFVPLTAVTALLGGEALAEEDWIYDPPSGCLLPLGKSGQATGPFRFARRTLSAVDRITGVSVEPRHVELCEFAPGAGVWFLATFADDDLRAVWASRLEAAVRWLADTGIGGLRSLGYGRSRRPDFNHGHLVELFPGLQDFLLGEPAGWWLWSAYSPAPGDRIAWNDSTTHFVMRAGRIESPSGWGTEKLESRMVAEGSLVISETEPLGAARNVAPEGFDHPVYRAGFAVALPLVKRETL